MLGERSRPASGKKTNDYGSLWPSSKATDTSQFVGDPQPRKAKTILVVDDHEDIRAFVAAALEAASFEVRTAPDGAQALALQRQHPADLLITDIFMPVKEGFETVSAFRAEFPPTKIIVMSAGTLPGLKHDFLASMELLGVSATLRKPFSADQLLDTVHQVLQIPQN